MHHLWKRSKQNTITTTLITQQHPKAQLIQCNSQTAGNKLIKAYKYNKILLLPYGTVDKHQYIRSNELNSRRRQLQLHSILNNRQQRIIIGKPVFHQS